YKPVNKRQYGYYTLPVLWGDQLVARFDSKLDRATNTFIILGFWLEDKALGRDEAFATALSAAFGRFQVFLGADSLIADGIAEPLLRQQVEQHKQ
ncbi:MAG: winged helix DNA-binding domain-containing protein, partial [Anaerolineales bacterium]|nr:winged helix DNA-binding domain-containing protein [Anaerolineales bacterium]